MRIDKCVGLWTISLLFPLSALAIQPFAAGAQTLYDELERLERHIKEIDQQLSLTQLSDEELTRHRNCLLHLQNWQKEIRESLTRGEALNQNPYVLFIESSKLMPTTTQSTCQL